MVTLREVMSEDVLTLEPAMSLRDARSALTRAGVAGAPVVAEGKLVGVLSAADLIAFDADAEPPPREDRGQSGWGDWPETMEWEEDEEPLSAYYVDYWDDAGADVLARAGRPEEAGWDLLEEHSVGEVMSRGTVALPPETAVEEAARRMTEAEVHRILVVEEDALLGVVSSRDVVGALAEHGLAE